MQQMLRPGWELEAAGVVEVEEQFSTGAASTSEPSDKSPVGRQRDGDASWECEKSCNNSKASQSNILWGIYFYRMH